MLVKTRLESRKSDHLGTLPDSNSPAPAQDFDEKNPGRRQLHRSEDGDQSHRDQCLDHAMEGSRMHMAGPQKTAMPVLPHTNDKRAPKMLDGLMLELDTLNLHKGEEIDGISRLAWHDPYEEYLSSKEGDSVSDYDLESLLDFDGSIYSDDESVASSSRASSRKSQEITATAVNFKVVGKPQLVEIHIPSRHSSPERGREKRRTIRSAPRSLDINSPQPEPSSSSPSLRRPSPLRQHSERPRSTANMSDSSSISLSPASDTAGLTDGSTGGVSASEPGRPLRKSSLAALSAAHRAASPAPSQNAFLDSDPYANAPSLVPRSTLPAPKTNTSLSTSNWKESFTRTLSKARNPVQHRQSSATGSSLLSFSQRASTCNMPAITRLNFHTESAASAQYVSHARGEDRETEVSKRRADSMPVTTCPREAPDTLEHMLRSAGRAPPPSPRKREIRKSFGLGLGRSLKSRQNHATSYGLEQ